MSLEARRTLEKMGVEVSLDDVQSPQEILNQINRARLALYLVMEPDEERRAAIEQFARKTYPLDSDVAQ